MTKRESEAYRERSAECMQRATSARDYQTRAALLRMGDTWLRLAEWAERLVEMADDGRSPTTTPAAQRDSGARDPVMQRADQTRRLDRSTP